MLTKRSLGKLKFWQIALFSLGFLLSLGVLTFAMWWFDCPPPPQGLFPPTANAATEDVYIVKHDWHTGLAWAQSGKTKIGPEAWLDAPYIEIGWGDRSFYAEGEKSLDSMFRAFFLSTPSALQVVGFDESPAIYFPNLEIWKIQLSTQGFERLTTYVQQTFNTTPNGSRLPPLQAKGQYGVSNFYGAIPDYGWWRTCNAWLAEGLHRAGLSLCPHRILLPQHLLDQIRAIATRVSN